MPHVDKKTGELVIRIVYDGAPEAGKTTNIQQLTSMIALQRRGAVESPGVTGRRTEYFDWLDFSGGYIDGRRVRCQLVTVPGQSQLLHRRKYLLEAADAIVFVADSRPAQLEEGSKNLAIMRRILEALDPKVPVGIVLQANKQDLGDALSASDLARAFELPPTIAVMASTASLGDGVMQTFILATRLATDRVRALLYEHTLADLDMDQETPAALLQAMIRLDGPLEVSTPAGSGPEASTSPERRRSSARPTVRVNCASPSFRPALGPDLEVSAGHVWPPVKGRALLANAGRASLHLPEFIAPWAPRAGIELTSDDWVFHTTDRWVFHDEARARLALLALVKQQLAWAELIPEGRALFLATEGERWRLWILTARSDTLREGLIAALRERDIDRVRRLFSRVEEFSHRTGLEKAASHVGPSIDALSIVGARIVALAVMEDGEPAAVAVDETPTVEVQSDLTGQLRSVAVAFAAGDRSTTEWLASAGALPGAEPPARAVAEERARP